MRVFLACSASENVEPRFKELASTVSTMLASHNHKLVFGGADTGMMGKCYMTFKYEEGKVKAVADVTNTDDIKRLEVDAYDITETTFERTMSIYNSSDLIVILPGGIGTIREFLAMIDEKRTKNANIPIVLYNYDNFYTPFLNCLKKMYEMRFISERDLKTFDIVTDVKSLELYMNRFEER